MIRKIATGIAVLLSLLVLSATPADARPVLDEPLYYGPGASATYETLCYGSIWPWKHGVICFRVPR